MPATGQRGKNQRQAEREVCTYKGTGDQTDKRDEITVPGAGGKTTRERGLEPGGEKRSTALRKLVWIRKKKRYSVDCGRTDPPSRKVALTEREKSGAVTSQTKRGETGGAIDF